MFDRSALDSNKNALIFKKRSSSYLPSFLFKKQCLESLFTDRRGSDPHQHLSLPPLPLLHHTLCHISSESSYNIITFLESYYREGRLILSVYAVYLTGYLLPAELIVHLYPLCLLQTLLEPLVARP